ncbi:hypothetical protein ZIOFF_008780 [Zingiber officinale]|uniref:UBA domain-containing protein n=1 Tax=Zingiber officinale TaxID=94328 RepID=A0A8J5IIP8_ZINOF|nr:hypothetical protein ZIOFF_008780 [Zingiber officinale]
MKCGRRHIRAGRTVVVDSLEFSAAGFSFGASVGFFVAIEEDERRAFWVSQCSSDEDNRGRERFPHGSGRYSGSFSQARIVVSVDMQIFIIFSILLSLILEALALAYLKETLSKLASGPYGLIFAAFLPFYFDIPVSSRFRVFGLNFTDKSLIYLAGLQLLFSSWKRSIVPGLCGLLAGSLYRLNVLGIRKLKFPEAFLSVFSRLPLPSSGSSPILARGNATGNMRPYPGHQMEEGGYPSQLERNHSDSTEASIATLVSMGFDRDSARRALTHAENDVNVATNILLESQSLR